MDTFTLRAFRLSLTKLRERRFLSL